MKKQRSHLGSGGLMAQRAILFCLGAGLELLDDFDMESTAGGEHQRQLSFKFQLHFIFGGTIVTRKIKGNLGMKINSEYCPVFWEDQCEITCMIDLLDGRLDKIGGGQFQIKSRRSRLEIVERKLEGEVAWQELEKAIARPVSANELLHAIVE